MNRKKTFTNKNDIRKGTREKDLGRLAQPGNQTRTRKNWEPGRKSQLVSLMGTMEAEKTKYERQIVKSLPSAMYMATLRIKPMIFKKCHDPLPNNVSGTIDSGALILDMKFIREYAYEVKENQIEKTLLLRQFTGQSINVLS